MSDIQNLHQEEAISKIRELAEGQICLFCTMPAGELISRPMGTQQVDDQGALWFLSRKGSSKDEQINAEDTVYLQYVDTGKHHYLSLKGSASIVNDRSKLDELWDPMAKAWFTEGKDDPSISIIRVDPEVGHYWDTKNGKLLSMLRIAVAAVTGNKGDGGIEGDLKPA